MAVQYDERKETILSESPEDLLTPDEASVYLGRLWKRPFSVKDFVNLRNNARTKAEALGVPLAEFFPIEPAKPGKRINLWRRSDLDYLAANVDPPRYRGEIYGKNRRKRTASN